MSGNTSTQELISQEIIIYNTDSDNDVDETIVIDDDEAEEIPQQPVEPVPTDAVGKTQTGTRFRLRCKKLFLTYPQCTTDKDVVLQNIKNFFEESLEWVVVSRELHADGQPHIHCAIALKKKIDLRGSSCLDVIANKHGNYRSMLKVVKCLEYVTKDGNFATFGIDVSAFLSKARSKKSTKSTLVAGIIQKSDGDIDPAHDADPGFFLLNKRKIEEYASYVRMKRRKKGLIPWSLFTFGATNSPEDNIIGAWLNKNVRSSTPRARKTKQLYIWGATNTGKTTLVDRLAKSCNVYIMPTEDFYDEWSNTDYDICIFDEFTACKTLQWLNQWLEGGMMHLRKKGSCIIKTFNIPTIILSNEEPGDVYHKVKIDKPAVFEAFLGRLEVVNVKQFIQLQ